MPAWEPLRSLVWDSQKVEEVKFVAQVRRKDDS